MTTQTHSQLIDQYDQIKEKLNELGYEIVTYTKNFGIVTKGGSLCATPTTVDGLVGFYDGVRVSKINF